jgi:hypothetical protein
MEVLPHSDCNSVAVTIRHKRRLSRLNNPGCLMPTACEYVPDVASGVKTWGR